MPIDAPSVFCAQLTRDLLAIAKFLLIFPCGSRRSKEVLSRTGDFLRLLVGELGTSKHAQIFAYGTWLYPYIMLLHGASDLDQSCLKTQNSEDECTFRPIFAPTPKITPNSHILGDLSMRNQCILHAKRAAALRA